MAEPVEPVPETDASPACPMGVYRCRHLQELDELRRRVEALGREVRSDALTGLFNYRYFSELLEQEVERAQRSGLPVALVMADLDHFKGVNDRYGHEVGNRVLQQVADILRSGVRRIDAVCRYGGEELALVLPGTQLPRAQRVAERLRREIAHTVVPLEGQKVGVTASFGVAVFPASGVVDAVALVRQADEALYRAKTEGRNRVCHTPLPPQAQVSLEEKRALLE